MRIAMAEDCGAVLSLIGMMHHEIGVGPMDEQRALEAAQSIISKGQCCLAVKGEHIVGTMGLKKGTFKYFSGLVLRDEWFYIHPDFRADRNERGFNAGHASRMIEWAKEAANITNLPLVLEMATADDTQVKLRWFRKRMRQVGGAFVHFPRAA